MIMSRVTPCLWFDGQAEEAVRFYVSLLPDSRIDAVVPYSAETPGGKPGETMVVEFTLAVQSYLALNGGPYYQFTPAVSFAIACKDQAEIDRLWADLLADGGAAQQCGWLTDRFGLSWQIVPQELFAMMKDKARAKAVTEAMLTMVKLDIAALRCAYEAAPA